jgi:hypothetical protein
LTKDAKERILTYYGLLAEKINDPSAATAMKHIVEEMDDGEVVLLEKKLAANDNMFGRISHHNNRIEYAIPPLKALPGIKAGLKKQIPLFVDCEIQTGMDAFKALALGANAVCIGRPLMTAIKNGGADAVAAYLDEVNAGLKKAMAFTGCYNLSRMDPTVVH